MWYFALEAHLPTQDQRFETLMTKGFVLSKGIVHVVNKGHLIIVRDGLETRNFSFENPSPADPVGDLCAHDGAVAALIAAAADPTDEDLKRFRIAPEVINELGSALRDSILATVPDSDTRQDLKTDAAGDGRTLLRSIKTSVEGLASRQASAIESLMTAHLASGLMSSRVAHFNQFSRIYINFNRCLGSIKKLPDSVIAERLVGAVNDLGQKIEILLTVEISTKAATGKLKETRAAIKTVLGIQEADDVKRASEGRALLANDRPCYTHTTRNRLGPTRSAVCGHTASPPTWSSQP